MVLALAVAICNYTVIIQMFLHEEIGLALISLFVCGPVAFFYGWAKANEWDNVLLMITWTVSGMLLLLVVLIWLPVVPSSPAYR
jgi:hypothetical protein